MTTTTYSSKVGMEFVIPLTIVFSISSALFIHEEAWFALLLNTLLAAGAGYAFFSIRYTISNNSLSIKSPLTMSLTIAIDDIQQIKETRNPLSSPAASIDRLEIVFRNMDSVLISPKRKKEFIHQLKEQNPSIEIVERKYNNPLNNLSK